MNTIIVVFKTVATFLFFSPFIGIHLHWKKLTRVLIYQAGAVKSLQQHYNMSMATVMGASAGIRHIVFRLISVYVPVVGTKKCVFFGMWTDMHT